MYLSWFKLTSSDLTVVAAADGSSSFSQFLFKFSMGSRTFARFYLTSISIQIFHERSADVKSSSPVRSRYGDVAVNKARDVANRFAVNFKPRQINLILELISSQ
jgi:hypothetical protein